MKYLLSISILFLSYIISGQSNFTGKWHFINKENLTFEFNNNDTIDIVNYDIHNNSILSKRSYGLQLKDSIILLHNENVVFDTLSITKKNRHFLTLYSYQDKESIELVSSEFLSLEESLKNFTTGKTLELQSLKGGLTKTKIIHFYRGNSCIYNPTESCFSECTWHLEFDEESEQHLLNLFVADIFDNNISFTITKYDNDKIWGQAYDGTKTKYTLAQYNNSIKSDITKKLSGSWVITDNKPRTKSEYPLKYKLYIGYPRWNINEKLESEFHYPDTKEIEKGYIANIFNIDGTYIMQYFVAMDDNLSNYQVDYYYSPMMIIEEINDDHMILKRCTYGLLEETLYFVKSQ